MTAVDVETGEIMDKPYLTSQHKKFANEILRQVKWVRKTMRDETDQDKFARLSPDTLSMVLMELTGMYESLSKWLADEKLHIADLKTGIDLRFADQYLFHKKESTNETAKMEAKLECKELMLELDKVKHDYDIVEAWKKTIGRYHDAVRSQLSYEKGMMSRG